MKIESRTADDLKHIRRRGLLSERLLQVACFGLYLIEQADIVDRDYGLFGERPKERDLSIGEGPWLDSDAERSRRSARHLEASERLART